MPTKLKIEDSIQDQLVLDRSNIREMTFKSSEIDRTTGIMTQVFELVLDRSVEPNVALNTGVLLVNHNTSVVLPEDSEEHIDKEVHKRSNFYDLRNTHTFLSDEYSKFFDTFSEREIPTTYVAVRDDLNKEEYDLYNPFSTNITKNKMEKFSEKLEKRHIRADDDILNKYQMFFFGKEYDFTYGSSNVSAFPYYNKITFSLNNVPKILNFLNTPDVNLYDKVVNDYMNSTKQSADFLINNQGPFSLEIVDLIDLVRNESFSFSGNMIQLPKQMEMSKIKESANRWLALSNMNKESVNYIRDYEQIMNGEDAVYEIMFTKIEKYAGNEELGRPAQTFIFSNNEEENMFFDTQVKNMGTYLYVCKTYVAIHGSSYTHEIINENRTEDLTRVRVRTTITPSIKIVEIPLFQKKVSVIKNPPLAPFVKFINNSNANNSIKIFLQLQLGRTTEKFRAITDSDRQVIDMLKPADSEMQTYKFEYAQQAGRFEVFKSNKRTNDYSFQSSFIVENSSGAPHVVFKDDIRPNRKYYYFFRTLDTYGVPSNPSAIYEVELIKDADSSKIMVNTVEIRNESEDLFQPDRKFSQFLHIRPAFNQVQITEGEEFDFTTYKNQIENFSIEGSSDPIWGRKFKIRVTSNSTGKKIDFNLVFDVVKEQSEENLK